MFKLDKRLESDTILVKELESFQVRLMNVREFFWIVLIPNKPNLTELSDLNINERNYLMNFAIDLGKFIKSSEKYDGYLISRDYTVFGRGWKDMLDLYLV